MANRNLLHRSKLADFKLWLEENGHITVDNPAAYQVLSWKAKSGPKPIIFDGKSSEHFSCNEASVPFVLNFIGKEESRVSKSKNGSIKDFSKALVSIGQLLGSSDSAIAYLKEEESELIESLINKLK